VFEYGRWNMEENRSSFLFKLFKRNSRRLLECGKTPPNSIDDIVPVARNKILA
jgi:hypothetical protein